MVYDQKEIKSSMELRTYIECLRKELIRIGQQHGLTSREAVNKSQELDNYLTIYQKTYLDNLRES